MKIRKSFEVLHCRQANLVNRRLPLCSSILYYPAYSVLVFDVSCVMICVNSRQLIAHHELMIFSVFNLASSVRKLTPEFFVGTLACILHMLHCYVACILYRCRYGVHFVGSRI